MLSRSKVYTEAVLYSRSTSIVVNHEQPSVLFEDSDVAAKGKMVDIDELIYMR
jgi:hypothetical protein